MFNKTIVALATPPMNGAIHIIRVSGANTYDIVNKISDSKIIKKGYSVQRVNIIDNIKKVDDVLLIKFVAPKSFTGEDLIEINCHGGIFLANKIISLLIKNGAQMASGGEFSKRAFINNKINLNQAHAIDNLIKASNDTLVCAAHNGLSGEVNKLLNDFVSSFFELVGKIEVSIDYPEYKENDLEPKVLTNNLVKVNKIIKEIIDESEVVSKHKEGINVTIVGKPNVGKSSLLNALAQENKAIVSSTPGTTRDVVDIKININGITYNFYDTAGIRNTSKNNIEKIGIKKSLQYIDKSDFVIFLIDGSKKLDEKDKFILNQLKDKKYIVVANKSDLSKVKNDLKAISISAKKNELKPLFDEISKQVKTLKIDTNKTLLLQSDVAIAYMKNVSEAIEQAIDLLKQKHSVETIVELLHSAHDNLLKIIGNDKDYNFINEMFKKFCLGK
jgi:tRNA modification GTPase